MELTCLRMACSRFVDGPVLASIASSCPSLKVCHVMANCSYVCSGNRGDKRSELVVMYK